MEEGKQQQQQVQQHHDRRRQRDGSTERSHRETQHQPAFNTNVPLAYGYVDTSWEAHVTMLHHLNHQQYHRYDPHPLHQSMDGVPLPPGIPGLGASTDPLEAVLGPFPCARLRNLPFDATLEDILILFQGLVVIDVVLIGQGEAFVIFANPMDYQMALQRDRQTIGRSFVAISPGSRSDYYAAIATQQWQEQQGGPTSRSSDEIHMGDDHHHHRDANGTELYGMISSSYPSQSSGAMHGGGIRGDIGPRRGGGGPMGGGPMGGRGNMGRGNPPGAMLKRSGGGIQVGDHTGYLRMRGLPFSAAKEDIYVFFDEYNTVSDSIVLTYRSDGRATGEAYVQFETAEDSKHAMDRHRNMMGQRYIELFLSNKEEHGRALARFGDR